MSKEFDTLNPVASQAERDLAFLEPSLEVTDFSSTRDIKTQKRLRKRPWFSFKMNNTGRFIQSMTVLGISLGGFILGLVVLGVPVKPTNIYLLFQHGYTGEHDGLQVVEYRGSTSEGSDNKSFFKIRGTIYNFDDSFRPPQDFSLNFYSKDGELMERYQFTCCVTDFRPNRMTPIEEIFMISGEEVAFFELKPM